MCNLQVHNNDWVIQGGSLPTENDANSHGVFFLFSLFSKGLLFYESRLKKLHFCCLILLTPVWIRYRRPLSHINDTLQLQGRNSFLCLSFSKYLLVLFLLSLNHECNCSMLFGLCCICLWMFVCVLLA